VELLDLGAPEKKGLKRGKKEGGVAVYLMTISNNKTQNSYSPLLYKTSS
jgi:hypothetical protein